MSLRVAILGAGVSGLSCAWLLKRRGIEATVFEATDHAGGLSRSFRWHDFDCDFGTHRLFTTDESVLRQLLALVPMGRHIRRSRVYVGSRWLHDPINAIELLYRFSPMFTARLAWGYLRRPRDGDPRSFNDFVIRRYGRAMNDFIFRPYTERLFGLPGDRISVNWAARKVRLAGPLDLLRENTKRKFSYFYYPVRGGFGAISSALFKELKGQVRLGAEVQSLEPTEGRISAVVSRAEGGTRRDEFDQVISTIPITVLGRLLGRDYALDFRGVDSVYLHVDQPNVTDNHWLYFMDAGNAINRLVEFKNLSPVGTPDDKTVLSAEVTDGGADPTQAVVRGAVQAGILQAGRVLDTLVVHEPFCYPVYSQGYEHTLADALSHLQQYPNLRWTGRGAEFEHKEVDDDFVGAGLVVDQLLRDVAPYSLDTERTETMPEPGGEPLVYVVILTFNHIDDTLECMASVLKQTYGNMRILVVDNGSTDGTPERVRAAYPDVQVIESGQNLGVPWGYNIGFAVALDAGARYVFMLNNDTVLATDTLQKVVEAAEEDDTTGMVMPKVLYYDEPSVIWAAGGRRRRFPPAIVIVDEGKDERQLADKPALLEFAISCGLLIHRRAFEKAGLFDPGYFFYFDDWDFSERVRAHGLSIRYAPGAKMWHKVSRTTRQAGNKAAFYQVWGESTTRFYRRHGRPVIISLPVHLAYIMAREVFKGNAYMLRSFVAGVRSGLSKPLGPLPSMADARSYATLTQRPREQKTEIDGTVPAGSNQG